MAKRCYHLFVTAVVALITVTCTVPSSASDPSPSTSSSSEETSRAPANDEGASGLSNRMYDAASPYLRAAADNPVFWQPYDDTAFQIAQLLDRPILLDVGSSWCHWCKVMDEESYRNPAVAGLINREFVAIKVDADQRPDLDRRYQQAAQIIAGEAGWPLTLLLTPKGDPFAGGTYFPANNAAGRPQLDNLLSQQANNYRSARDKVTQRSADIANTLAGVADAGVVRGTIGLQSVDQVGDAILSAFDPQYGGFGNGAKYPAPQTIELALDQYKRRGDERFLEAATRTLDAMGSGAVRDQLTGAFHRFALDPLWQVPHFEIIAALNAEISVAYLHACSASYDQRYCAVAERAIGYLNSNFVDRQRGGFYSSQAPDANEGDDGHYYTWTADEIRAALPADEAPAALIYFGIPEANLKPGASWTGRSALHVAQSISAVAVALNIPTDQARSRLESARHHLLAARERRVHPPIDHTFLVDRNGGLAASYFEAYRILNRPDLRDIALAATKRLLELPREDGLLAHSYMDDRPVARGMLDDQIATSLALMGAFSETGELQYLAAAGELLDRTIAKFWDKSGKGFQDVADSAGPGAAGRYQHLYDDGMISGGNPLAATALNRYYLFTGKTGYRELATETLGAFAGAVREFGPFASGYALALSQHLAAEGNAKQTIR